MDGLALEMLGKILHDLEIMPDDVTSVTSLVGAHTIIRYRTDFEKVFGLT
jgi:hypothetical protein